MNTQGAVGTPSSYAEMTAAVRAILAANYPGEVSGLSWIQNPDVAAVYDGLTDSTGQPLQPTPWAAALSQHPTTALAASGGEYGSVVGDFRQMLIGARTSGFMVDIIPAGTVGFGAIAAGAVTSIKVQQGYESDGSDMADLEGTGAAVADTDDNGIAAVDFALAQLSRHYDEPVPQPDLITTEVHQAPSEGTP